MHVVVTGGTGLIGSHLVDRLRARDDEVTVVSRDPTGGDQIGWDPDDPGSLVLPDTTDAVVHLAGAPIVGERWDENRKQAIRSSRVQGTQRVVEAVEAHGDIQHVVSGSAVGYYGDRGEEPLDEHAEPGEDFMAQVTQVWEAEARRLEGHEAVDVDPARIRTGTVLAEESGALPEMLNPFGFVKPFHWGMGGRLGDGQQWFAWIHVEDEVRAILHVLDEGLSGPFNLVAPGVVRNEQFTEALGEALGRPTPFPVPEFALRLVVGEVAEVLTASQRVRSDRLQETGFSFRYPQIRPALADLLGEEDAVPEERAREPEAALA
jgi:uncharacterized protein (TIGR01777 family)